MTELARPVQYTHTQRGRAAVVPLQDLPLVVGMSYLTAIFVLFLTWPIDWPIFGDLSWARLIAYVSLCYAAIASACVMGRSGSAANVPLQPFRSTRLVVVGGAIAAVVLLFPTSVIYTGRWPWQILEALRDQGDAYRSLYDQLLATDGQRGPIALARALAAPLTFAIIPLGMLNWGRLDWFARGCVAVAASCSITLSILRGTDREFADLFIVVGSTLFVLMGRQSQVGGRVLALIKRYWLPAVLLALFVWVAIGLFTDRKTSRLGGYENRVVVCANSSRICADIDAPLIAWMPTEQRFATSLFVLSSASGFYGLSLGMEQDFQPSWGFGHSPAAMAVADLVAGKDSVRPKTYTFRNTFQGWSDENYWSTLILWLANDVGFVGAVFVLALIGFVWGRAWRDATRRKSDPAAVMFCLVMIMIAYLPANNQVFALYEGYTVFAVWLIIWLRQPALRLSKHLRA
jgi:hypothetical protein